MDYIEICEWNKFQHYKKRNPPWIKLYASILDDDDFDCLQDDSKLLFFCLLPFASRRNNKMLIDFPWLQKKLPINKKITRKTLQPLINAGFMACYQDDSKMIAECKQDAMPEESREETEKRQRKGFIPPTLEELQKYITEKSYTVDAKKFLEWYTEADWRDNKGNLVKNWKLKVISWSNRDGGEASGVEKKCIKLNCYVRGAAVYADDTGQKYFKCKKHGGK